MNSAVLIPSLNPDEKMTDYVKALSEFGFKKIIVVDDGSPEEYRSFFDAAAAVPGCVVLRHEVNKGKGCALKTGMKYYLENISDCDGIVTADADGQHTLEDAANISELISTMDDALILGSRDFSGEDVPPRSRFGNRTTSVVFKVAHGTYLNDTQTGLRGIPNKLIPLFSEIAGERYEYEMNMLVECSKRDIKMIEEPIKTVYIDENKSSHFHVIRDSVKVYWLVLRDVLAYLFSGGLSYVVDYVTYLSLNLWIFPLLLLPFADRDGKLWIFLATLFARIISSLFNFMMNKLIVFKSHKNTGKHLFKYALLVVAIMLTSWLLVWTFSNWIGISSLIVKPIVDLVLVIVSYTAQRTWVFRGDSDEELSV